MIISTVAHPKANSYLSLEEANERLSKYYDISWDTLTDLEKENILRLVTSKIDMIRFLGAKFYYTQSLEFPRRYDARVTSVVFSSILVEGVETETVTFRLVDGGTKTYELQPSQSFFLPDFPNPNSLAITYTYQGTTYTVTDDGNGNLIGGFAPGTVNYNTREIDLGIAPDNGTIIQINASIMLGNALTSEAFKLDKGRFLPDHFKYGSVHQILDNGDRVYYDITKHNIVEGIIYLSDSLKQRTGDMVMFEPYFSDLKDAIEFQVAAELGSNIPAWDRLEGRDIRSVKIGDTARTYGGTSNPYKSKTDVLAGKYRVHPIVFAKLGKYTVYGKMGAMIGGLSK